MHPKIISANIGSRVSFECYTVRQPQWIFNSFTTPPISFSNKLVIEPVSLTDAGEYFCYGEYYNNPRNFLAKGLLKVYGKLTFDRLYLMIAMIKS